MVINLQPPAQPRAERVRDPKVLFAFTGVFRFVAEVFALPVDLDLGADGALARGLEFPVDFFPLVDPRFAVVLFGLAVPFFPPAEAERAGDFERARAAAPVPAVRELVPLLATVPTFFFALDPAAFFEVVVVLRFDPVREPVDLPAVPPPLRALAVAFFLVPDRAEVVRFAVAREPVPPCFALLDRLINLLKLLSSPPAVVS